MEQALEHFDTSVVSSRAMQQDVQESARYANVYTSGSTIARKDRNSGQAAMFDSAPRALKRLYCQKLQVKMWQEEGMHVGPNNTEKENVKESKKGHEFQLRGSDQRRIRSRSVSKLQRASDPNSVSNGDNLCEEGTHVQRSFQG